MTFEAKQATKVEVKVQTSGAGGSIYLSKDEMERLGIEPGEELEKVVHPDGSITLKKGVKKYSKFLRGILQGGINMGEPVDVAGVQIIPIYAEQELERDYITLPEALAKGEVRIHDSGMIGQVSAENVGGMGVLVIAGQIVGGQTQTRAVVSSLILPTGRTTPLPTRCVHSDRGIVGGAPMDLKGIAPRLMTTQFFIPLSQISQSNVWEGVKCLMATCSTIFKMDRWIFSSLSSDTSFQAQARTKSITWGNDLGDFNAFANSVGEEASKKFDEEQKKKKDSSGAGVTWA